MAEESKFNFSRDWFGRRADDKYTYGGGTRYFDWDRGRDNYSSYFIQQSSSVEEAATMVGSMFRVIGVDKNANFKPNSVGQLGTNDVQIPLSMLLDENKKYTKDKGLLDSFYGAAIQNASLKSFQSNSEYSATLQDLNASNKAPLMNTLRGLLNVERIDKKLAERYPGYLKFVQKFKDYKYDKSYTPPAEDASAKVKLLDLVTRMLRYPTQVTEEEMTQFAKPLAEIKEELNKVGGIPDSFNECSQVAENLSRIIYNYVDVEEEKEEKKNPSGGDKGPSNEELDEMARAMMGEMTDANDGNPPADSEGSKLKKDAKKFEETMDLKSNHIPYEDDFTFDKQKTKFIVAKPNEAKYRGIVKNVDLTKAHVLRTLFSRKSKDHDFSIKAMRSGRFDTNKIAEAKQNVPTVYERIGHVSTNKICVGVLIDESGK